MNMSLQNTKPATAEAARETQVEDWMNRLQKSLAEAAEVQAHLRSRLLPVTRDPHADKKSDVPAPDIALVPVADKLRDAARAVERLIQNDREILELLEV
jgi:hypothetical protein